MRRNPGSRHLAAQDNVAVLQNNQSSAFLTKLRPDGSSIAFSTLLNGHVSFQPVVTYAAEPGGFVAVHFGNLGAIYPNSPEARERGAGTDAR